MKALTICQPYAEMIVRGEKRIENRTWPTMHRGYIYIHAGKSKEWWDEEIDRVRYPNAAWGAVVAIARLVNCVRVGAIHEGKYDDVYPWAREHEHANGPWCWILENVRAIEPRPWRGAQGLFDIDSEALGVLATREAGITQPITALRRSGGR